MAGNICDNKFPYRAGTCCIFRHLAQTRLRICIYGRKITKPVKSHSKSKALIVTNFSAVTAIAFFSNIIPANLVPKLFCFLNGTTLSGCKLLLVHGLFLNRYTRCHVKSCKVLGSRLQKTVDPTMRQLKLKVNSTNEIIIGEYCESRQQYDLTGSED